MRQKHKITNDSAETMHLSSKTFIYTDKTIRISTKAAYTLSTVKTEELKNEESESKQQINNMINDIKTETKDFSINEIKLLIKHEALWSENWDCDKLEHIEKSEINQSLIENNKGSKTIEYIRNDLKFNLFILPYLDNRVEPNEC